MELLVLIGVCIFGFFVIAWRRLARLRISHGSADVPGIFMMGGLADLVVLAVGTVAFFGTVLVLLMSFGLGWALLGVVLAVLLGGWLARISYG
jgi:hypothetical protein